MTTTEIAAKLDANESPYDLPPAIKAEILEQARHLEFNRYETPYLQQLKTLLARHNQMGEDQIVVGNGSDELIQLLCHTWGGPQTAVVFPAPTFTVYRFAAEQARCPVRPVPLEQPGFDLNLEALELELGRWPSCLTFICRPNNPTGSNWPRREVQHLLDRAPGLVVIDEAYVEFSGDSLGDWLERYPQLVILRTLSKAFRLAGLRVGYLLASPRVARSLEETRMPYNVGVFSQMAAALILQHREQLEGTARQIVRQRRELAQQLAFIFRVQVYPSWANFLLLETPLPAGELERQLREGGIAVRSFPGEPGLECCVRVSVGTPQENQLLLEQMALLLQGGPQV